MYYFVHRDKRPGVANSLAMEGASNIRTCYYRSGYDMSVPLSPERLFLDLADIPATERRFFLTVKVHSRMLVFFNFVTVVWVTVYFTVAPTMGRGIERFLTWVQIIPIFRSLECVSSVGARCAPDMFENIVFLFEQCRLKPFCVVV